MDADKMPFWSPTPPPQDRPVAGVDVFFSGPWPIVTVPGP